MSIEQVRRSPNCWYVGDTYRIGSLLFRAVCVYPDVLFEVVDDVD